MLNRLALFVFASLFVFAVNSQAQTDSVSSGKKSIKGNNEFKSNLAYAIAGFPEISYERILKNNNALGLAVVIGLERDLDYKLGIIPYYRIYFGNKKASGFFIEGNAAMVTREIYYFTVYDQNGNAIDHIYNKSQTRFGVGGATGVKFLTKSGFIGEAFVGLGGLYGSSRIGKYLRSGVTIGRRF